MDMDVFLSGPNGMFTEKFGVNPEKHASRAQVNSEFQKAVIDSALANKKETLLGWMQKVDSYIFDVQKVPHFSGRYVLDLEKKVIRIENERLTWQLVLGNLLFFLYRMLLVCVGFFALGWIFLQRIVFGKFDQFITRNWRLSLPYFLDSYQEYFFTPKQDLKLYPNYFLSLSW